MAKVIRSPYENLHNKMFVTKAARFNADKRLRLEHKLTNISLALISTYLIALSVAPTFQVGLLPKDASYEFWALVFSVALLGISLLQAGSEKLQEAFFLHQNAMKIDKLLGELSAYTEKDIPQEILNRAYKEYAETVAECEFNHCKIDELWFRTWNSWLGGYERAASFLLWALFSIYHYGTFLAVVAAPFLIPLLLKPVE